MTKMKKNLLMYYDKDEEKNSDTLYLLCSHCLNHKFENVQRATAEHDFQLGNVVCSSSDEPVWYILASKSY